MQYNRLGNTGLIISRLAFGAMTFGSATDHPMANVFNTPEKTADLLIGRSLDACIKSRWICLYSKLETDAP